MNHVKQRSKHGCDTGNVLQTCEEFNFTPELPVPMKSTATNAETKKLQDEAHQVMFKSKLEECMKRKNQHASNKHAAHALLETQSSKGLSCKITARKNSKQK